LEGELAIVWPNELPLQRLSPCHRPIKMAKAKILIFRFSPKQAAAISSAKAPNSRSYFRKAISFTHCAGSRACAVRPTAVGLTWIEIRALPVAGGAGISSSKKTDKCELRKHSA
jgi:hypothetical protein